MIGIDNVKDVLHIDGVKSTQGDSMFAFALVWLVLVAVGIAAVESGAPRVR